MSLEAERANRAAPALCVEGDQFHFRSEVWRTLRNGRGDGEVRAAGSNGGARLVVLGGRRKEVAQVLRGDRGGGLEELIVGNDVSSDLCIAVDRSVRRQLGRDDEGVAVGQRHAGGLEGALGSR